LKRSVADGWPCLSGRLVDPTDAAEECNGQLFHVQTSADRRYAGGQRHMRKLNVSTLVTLDGVIQDPGGFQELDEGGWGNRYFDDEAQSYALEHLRESSDAFLCGRVTFEVFKEFWPQVKEGEYAQTLNRMRKFVASRTLTEPLEWNATLLEGDVADAVADLKQQEGRDIVMYGSAGLMATLMAHDLIDEYRIWIHPLVIGTGTRLFDEGVPTRSLEHVETRQLSTGVVILVYRPQ
jgi:dihydrofolate reductase